jgi:hypothetical protein
MATVEYPPGPDVVGGGNGDRADGLAILVGGLDFSAILGTWFATDEDIAGVVELRLRRYGDRVVLHTFSAGSPQPADWGEAAARTYGVNAAATEAIAFSARYEFGFMSTIVTAYTNGGLLVLDTFNSFTDSSGRAPYFTRQFFHR